MNTNTADYTPIRAPMAGSAGVPDHGPRKAELKSMIRIEELFAPISEAEELAYATGELSRVALPPTSLGNERWVTFDPKARLARMESPLGGDHMSLMLAVVRMDEDRRK